MTERLTQRRIDELVEQIERGEKTKGEKIFDAVESGLIVFVGAKVVSYRYRQIEAKRETMLTLGNSKNLTLAGARKLVQTIKQKKEERRRQKVLGRLLGLNVVVEERPLVEEPEIRNQLPKIKVAEVVNVFHEWKQKEELSASTKQQHSHYTRLINEALGEIDASTLPTKTAIDFLDTQPDSRRSKMACFLRNAFDHAVSTGILTNSPLKAGFEKSVAKAKATEHIAAPKSLNEYLSAITTGFNSTKVLEKRCFFLLLQLLPMRINELSKLKWSDIDLSDNTLTFVQTKVNKKQVLPINSLAVSVFKAVNPEIFSSISKTEFPKVKLNKEIFSIKRESIRHVFEKCTDFSPHSVRSCFSTFLLDLKPEFGISRDDIESCLGHKTDCYQGAYQRSREVERKKKTLDIWTRILCSSPEVRSCFRSCSGFPQPDPRFPVEFLTDKNDSDLEIQRQLKNLTDSI